MPLSEHEQKMLEEMERALYAEDPSFATQMRGSGLRSVGRHGRSRQVLGGVGVLVGIGVVVLAITTQLIWVGAIGFAVMVASAAWALTPGRPPLKVAGAPVKGKPAAGGPRAQGQPRQAKGKRSSGRTFMQRLEERWERRRNDRR